MSHIINSQIADNLVERLEVIEPWLDPKHLQQLARLLDSDLEEADNEITRLEHEISFALSGRDL